MLRNVRTSKFRACDHGSGNEWGDKNLNFENGSGPCQKVSGTGRDRESSCGNGTGTGIKILMINGNGTGRENKFRDRDGTGNEKWSRSDL